MTLGRTDYEKFEQSSEANRRLLREEELILETTEVLCEALQKARFTKSELAVRLNKSKGFVSQLLAGGRNLTLRTLADVADALKCSAHFVLEPEVRQVPADKFVTQCKVIKFPTAEWENVKMAGLKPNEQTSSSPSDSAAA